MNGRPSAKPQARRGGKTGTAEQPPPQDEAGGAAAAGLKPRQLASALLKAVLVRRQPLDETFNALASRGRFAAPSHRDKAFARAMSATALRRLGQSEDILARFLEHPLPEDAQDVKFVLLLAVTQLAFMGAAPHAVINIAVDETRLQRNGARFAGLVNAVLRRVAASAPEIIAGQDAAELNTPAWLFSRWASAYGEEQARAIAAAHLDDPPLDLSLKPEAWDDHELKAALGGAELPPRTLRLKHRGRVDALPGYESGAWWVQDHAASLPATLLGPVAGKTVADLCAAPGGKTAQLAAAGARVTAVDTSRSRLRRLGENLARLRLAADLVEADAAAWTPAAPFDAVLLDAPCSATGTIRRNPDIPYLKSQEDIAALSRLQKRLADHAVTLLKPGGVLVYCTCSLEPEEGENLASALATRESLAPAPIGSSEVSDPAWITPEGYLRTLPSSLRLGDGINGMDGFFAARFRRTGPD
jgi:16S rRNA (cytosine967-C5)-methyltransferase